MVRHDIDQNVLKVPEILEPGAYPSMFLSSLGRTQLGPTFCNTFTRKIRWYHQGNMNSQDKIISEM